MTTAYGSPAHGALAEAVAQAKGGDALAPVTVVVPSHYVGLAARRALGRRLHNGTRGIAAVAFHTPYSLAEHLGGAEMAAQGRRGVTNAVIAAAVRAALRREPGHFGGVETHPATEHALTRAHRELSELEDRQLDALRHQSPRARDVVRIHREVAAALREKFSNEQQLARAAAAAVRARPSEARDRLGRVIVFLPQNVTASQAHLLQAVSEVTDTTIVAAVTGADDADATVRASLQRLGADLDASTSSTSSEPNPPADGVTALGVSDADDEVRHALRAVVGAARAGTPLGRCAVLYGLETPYVRLIGDALDAAGIERCGATARTVETSLLGRSLLDMLALRDSGFSRRAVMAWLAAAPVSVKRPDDSGENADSHRWRGVPSAAWERAARAARVESGLDSWTRRLDRYAADCTAEADRLSHDEDQLRRADRIRVDAERALELRAFVEGLHLDLNPQPAPRSWADLAAWCQRLVQKYLGGRVRRRWPDDERGLAERVDSAISRLGDLDGTDDNPSPAAFRRALQLELETSPSRHGRLGAGVLVGSVDLALGVELDLAVVCGMAEGTFPARRDDDALLPDRERRVAGGDLPARGDRSGEDHRALLAVVAAAKQTLLLYPRGDLRRSADRSPSRWLTEQATSPDEVPSFVAGLRRASFPAHEHEYDTRCLLDWHDSRGRDDDTSQADLIRLPSVRRRVELQRGIELRRSRLSRRLTRFDGNLAAGDLRDAALPHPTGSDQVTSASSLEAWATCPHSYFMRYLLRVEAVDDRDDDHRISPLERGSLVHRILERWLTEAINDNAVPAPDEPWPERWLARLAAVGEQECDRLEARGLVGRRLYWAYDRHQVLADLDRFLEFDNEQRAGHRSRPVAAELGFGMPHSASGPVSVEIGNGRSVSVRGSIDRVDATPHGGLLVVDYKTGSARAYQKLGPDDPTLGGHRLQLVLYDLAARSLLGIADTADGHGAYWFVSTKGQFSDIGYATNTARRQVLKAVNTIIVFPLHPDEPVWRPWVPCGYCDPDGMGTRDQWRDFQRKRDDPALARYLDLVDPDRDRSDAPQRTEAAT
ncbi:MAG: PD-(D/E)XK nuclease family protein [Acidimicrobiia bacterium]|nr:PD-(D/E)XK nuclease family protein [Acidimicrobiia bacterium]